MTTSDRLPAWLAQATQSHRDAQRATGLQANANDTPTSPAPAPGQIRRLDPMDPGAEPLLVIIVTTDPASAAAQVLALSSEIEMGSDTDTLLPASTTGLTYDLLVLTDITGPAWYVQFGPTLAAVKTSQIHDAPAGTPVEGPTDPRWQWKQERHDALITLLGECARQVIDESPDSVIDPAAFDLSAVSATELARMVRVAAPLLARSRVCMPMSAMRHLNASRVTAQSRYWDSVRCLIELIPRRPDLVVNELDGDSSLSWLAPAEHQDLAEALNAAFRRLPEAHRSLRLLTLNSLWSGTWPTGTSNPLNKPADVREAAPGVWELYIAGRRHQLLVQPVDEFDPEPHEPEHTTLQDSLRGALHVG